MNKQELIKDLKKRRGNYLDNGIHSGIRQGISIAIDAVERLDEPAKVVIPQVVADFIEKQKGWDEDRQEYVEDDATDLLNAMDLDNASQHVDVVHYLLDNSETFAKAWIEGYDVKKEKLYYVLDKQGKTLLVLMGGEVRISGGYVLSESTANKDIYQLTEKQIKDYDERFWEFAVEVQE